MCCFEVLLNDFMICKICGNAHDHKTFQVREMMFGYREWFTYFQCSRCACLQIAEIPADMAKYYPANYYSLTQSPVEHFKNPVKNAIRKLRNNYAFFGNGILGRWLYEKYPAEYFQSLSRVPDLTRTTRILDVGCGAGALLYALRESEFENLLGVDPFIETDIEYENGLKILQKKIDDLVGEWDLIMFHHVFEHLPDPLEALQAASRLLAPTGACLIRTPTVSSWAWEHYGVNWVQLDAPRHFFIHSLDSLERVAKKANLQLTQIVYDATTLQFWGSEQYRKNIPFMSEQSYFINPSRSVFSRAEINQFKQKTRQLNDSEQGDAAAFYLKKN